MKKDFFLISMAALVCSIFIISSLQYKSFALTQQEQRNLIGFAIGCKDALAGKSPDRTQFDKAGGFSTHSVEYNLGYITGYNSCSTNQKIGQ